MNQIIHWIINFLKKLDNPYPWIAEEEANEDIKECVFIPQKNNMKAV